MSQLFSFINAYTILGIPLLSLLIALLIIMFTFLFKKVFTHLLIKYVRKLAQKTKTEVDEMLLHSIEGPLKMAILGAGFFVAHLFISSYLSNAHNSTFKQGFQLFFLIVICWFLYRSIHVMTLYLQKLAERTPTELDDILLPYLQKVVKVGLIVLVIFKIAEIILGMSVAALLGLLGGMGLTLGLVFKDIVANWFGCAIIYMDRLFQEGDWIQLNDGKIVDADVEEIGLRSTKFRNFDKTISIVPNAMIAESVVKNWSKMYKRRVKYNFTIDGITSDKLKQTLNGIREILSKDDEVHQEFHMVNFREIEGNSRTIRLYYFTASTVWKEHEQIRENINLKILALFENLGIHRLNYTIVDLSDDRPKDFSLNMEKN